MHEEWLNTGSNEEAINRGQANTGRVISAAALIMICVFFSFAFGASASSPSSVSASVARY